MTLNHFGQLIATETDFELLKISQRLKSKDQKLVRLDNKLFINLLKSTSTSLSLSLINNYRHLFKAIISKLWRIFKATMNTRFVFREQ